MAPQTKPIPSSLNPRASEYVPLLPQASPQIEELLPTIDSVPRDILETVLSFLDDPRDVASAARTCRAFAEAAASAPLGVALSPPRSRRAPPRLAAESGAPPSPPLSPPPLSVAARVRSLGECWPGTTSLSLGPGPPSADDAAVSLALRGRKRGKGGSASKGNAGGQGGGGEARSGSGGGGNGLPLLPRLQELRLDRCTKLTSAAFAEDDGDEGGEEEGGALRSLPPLSRLRLLGADRCFSLSADALTLALRASAAAATDHSSRSARRRLSSLALSHLDLSEWPPAAAPKGKGKGGSESDSGGESDGEAEAEEEREESEGEGEGEPSSWNEPSLSAAVDDDEATPEEGAALAWDDAGALDERRRRRRGSKLSSPELLLGRRGRGCLRPCLPPSATTNLRCLALTNCSSLTLRGLDALCEAAPLLRVLALGGSSLGAASPSSLSSAPLVPFEDGNNSSSASSSSSSSSSSALRAAHIGAATAALSSSRGAVARVGSPGTLLLGSPPPPLPLLSTSPAGSALRGAPLAALRAAIAAEIGGGGGEIGGGSGSSSAGSPSPPPSTAACFGGGSFSNDGGFGTNPPEGALLSCCLRRCVRLRCVELTFWPKGTDSIVARSLEAAAATEGGGGGRRRRAAVVWSLARGADAAAAASAAAARSSAAALLRLSDGEDDEEEETDGEETQALFEGLRLALRAAANCSSTPGRQSPLHLAAASSSSGDPFSATAVSALVSLGAQPDARDRSGATPCFVAAEAGREGALRALLERGKADARARNSAGEAPLYIASLRGHAGAVEALLDSFRRERSNSSSSSSSPSACWTDSSLYGDGWTPVMAAALGGRKEVLRTLLAAAAEADGKFDGENGDGENGELPRPSRRGALLVRAANRYGQTALHIAARRGCRESLGALLEAAREGEGDEGGSEEPGKKNKRPVAPVAALRDASGDSAADVAARAGHFQAATLLSSAASASASAPVSAYSSASTSPSYDAENVRVISPEWRPSENVLLLGRRRRAAW